MTPRVVDKDTKKQEILLAALEVFSRKGFAKTKMIDVAEAAGIGKGTIYEYFRSKEQVFAETFHFFMQKSELLLQDAFSKTDDPVEKLRIFIEIGLVQLLEDSGEFMSITMDFWAEGIRAKSTKIMDLFNLKELYDHYRTLINDVLQEGIQSGVFKPINTFNTASAIIAAMDGLMLQWILDPTLFDLKEVAEDFTTGLLNGIKRL